MKVSVLLFTYNHEKYIADAINSTLNQDVNFDYEIIIIDDFSTDRTRDIIIDFQKRFPDKIRLMLSEYNKNNNLDLIKAFQDSRGEYIAGLDGDDYWTSPHKLQKQVDYLDNNPEIAICFHNARVFHENGSHEDYNFNPDNQKEISTVEDLLKECFIFYGSSMIRKDLLSSFPTWFYSMKFADWALFILYAEKGKMSYINEIMAAYRIHKGGFYTSLSDIQKVEACIKFYEIMNKNLNFKYNKTIKRRISHRYYELAIAYENNGDFDKAKNSLLKSIVIDPFNKTIPFRDKIHLAKQLYFNIR
jgi:glycosyltransferase involved in cell wall biosynthesis